jgi:hypothetical protein
LHGCRVGIIISGGNVDSADFDAIVHGALKNASKPIGGLPHG